MAATAVQQVLGNSGHMTLCRLIVKQLFLSRLVTGVLGFTRGYCYINELFSIFHEN